MRIKIVNINGKILDVRDERDFNNLEEFINWFNIMTSEDDSAFFITEE